MSAMLPALSRYQLRLPAFEGPLDVLLHLIERERLEISDVSLVAVTDGFLSFIAELVDPPPALLAEFAGIASRLLVLKSRSLLPRRDPVESDLEPDDLAVQLREYQRAKQAAERLRAAEDGIWRSFGRPPLTTDTPPRVILTAPPLGHLRRALLRAVSRMRPEPEITRMRPIVSIGAMIQRIRDGLAGVLNPASFAGIVNRESREELVAGFIALLALWRRGEIGVRQDTLWGEIWLERAAEPGGAGDGDG